MSAQPSASQVDRYAWWRALRESDLAPTPRLVALVISTYMTKDGAGAWPSMGTLASDTGLSRRSVARAVRELEEAGYVDVTSGGGRRGDGGYVSNRYAATVPNGDTGGTVTPLRATGNGDTGGIDDTGGAVTPATGAVTPATGAVTSVQGTVTPATGNGDTGGTRGTQELALQPSKQHSVEPTTEQVEALAGQILADKYDEFDAHDLEHHAVALSFADRADLAWARGLAREQLRQGEQVPS